MCARPETWGLLYPIYLCVHFLLLLFPFLGLLSKFKWILVFRSSPNTHTHNSNWVDWPGLVWAPEPTQGHIHAPNDTLSLQKERTHQNLKNKLKSFHLTLAQHATPWPTSIIAPNVGKGMEWKIVFLFLFESSKKSRIHLGFPASQLLQIAHWECVI